MSEPNFNLKCTLCGADNFYEVLGLMECGTCFSRWNGDGQFLWEGPRKADLEDWVLVSGAYKGIVKEVGPFGFRVLVVLPKPNRWLFVGRNDVVKLDRRPFQIADKVRVFASGEIGMVTGALGTGVNVHLAERGETVHFDADELDHTS